MTFIDMTEICKITYMTCSKLIMKTKHLWHIAAQICFGMFMAFVLCTDEIDTLNVRNQAINYVWRKQTFYLMS